MKLIAILVGIMFCIVVDISMLFPEEETIVVNGNTQVIQNEIGTGTIVFVIILTIVVLGASYLIGSTYSKRRKEELEDA